tara:strand:- start:219 stop:395 length:177 start_codon:yes stop_codon:yes gene_type:complete
MTIENRNYRSWITEELQSLLDAHIFNRDRFAETFTDRADLNKEIQLIKNEIIRREKRE